MFINIFSKHGLSSRNLINFRKNLFFYNFLRPLNIRNFYLSMMEMLWVYKPYYFLYTSVIPKSIRKAQKGKLGKFKFTWKYIPIPKRWNLIFHILKKNYFLLNGYNIFFKWDELLFTIFKNSNNSLLYKYDIFSKNYILKNSKKLLY